MAKIVKCKTCNEEIAANAKVCPHCGAKNKKPFYKAVWFWAIIVVVIIIAIAAGSGSNSSSKSDSGKTETTQEAQAAVDSKSNEQSVPTEYKNALKKAKSYSDNMHMSKARLYDQLTSEYGEKFSAEAAQYAIDNVQADWNANALAKAKSYYNDMSMSKDRVYDQLVSEYGEKFTAEQAQYAIDHLDD